jgi:hypothetical protein
LNELKAHSNITNAMKKASIGRLLNHLCAS